MIVYVREREWKKEFYPVNYSEKHIRKMYIMPFALVSLGQIIYFNDYTKAKDVETLRQDLIPLLSALFSFHSVPTDISTILLSFSLLISFKLFCIYNSKHYPCHCSSQICLNNILTIHLSLE